MGNWSRRFRYASNNRIEIDYFEVLPDYSVTTRGTSSTTVFGPDSPFTIAITSVTGGRIKGTFSGSTTNFFERITATKVITEVGFDLPVEN